MKKLFTAITIAGAMLLGVTASASAATFTFNFCPAASAQCTAAGVTQVTASFAEITTGSDPNDHNVTLTVVGGISGSYIDELLISIGNLTYPTDYESVGGLTSDSGKTYVGPTADNIPGCGEVPLSGNDFCFYTPGNGTGEVAGPGITNTFTFTVDLIDSAPAITSTTAMNFRFQLEDADGGNQAIFSPNGVYNTTTTSTTTTSTTTTTTNNTTTSPSTVPEPGMLALLGAGLGAAAQRLRRRRNS